MQRLGEWEKEVADVREGVGAIRRVSARAVAGPFGVGAPLGQEHPSKTWPEAACGAVGRGDPRIA